MKVLILGCGPAGLIAAHAARTKFDADIAIVSRKRPSQLFGCQYLHEPIPGIDVEQAEVNYVAVGTFAEYQKKVYGDRQIPVPASPQLLTGRHPAWDIRGTYETLYWIYEPYVQDHMIERHEVQAMLQHYAADAVINSIPMPLLCQKGEEHAFDFIKCYAMGDSPERKVPMPMDEFTVVCDGTENVSWYRKAHVFGYGTAEWSGHRRKPPLNGVVDFLKPLSNDCDCLPVMHRVGRMGEWRKGVLAHTAWHSTIDYLTTVNEGAFRD